MLATAEHALTTTERYLDRCKLSPHTVRAYRRQCAAFVAWLREHAAEHSDARRRWRRGRADGAEEPRRHGSGEHGGVGDGGATDGLPFLRAEVAQAARLVITQGEIFETHP